MTDGIRLAPLRVAATLAGKPVVGVGMQIEQVANLACLERLGFAIRVPKSKNPARHVQAAIQKLLHNQQAKAKADASPKSSRGGMGQGLRPTCCSNITGQNRGVYVRSSDIR